MNAEEWKPTGFRLDTEDLSYLGQIWQSYTPEGEPVWRGVMTHFAGHGGFKDVATGEFPGPGEAKEYLLDALGAHRTAKEPQ
jgi:hypothetical protein